MAAVLINLLPDVRLAKIRANQIKRLTTAIGSLVIGSCLGVLLVLFLITQGQYFKIASLQTGIDQKYAEIKNVQNLGIILTTQQHLASLPALYSQRVYLSRFFAVLSSVSPKDLALQKMEIDAKNEIKFIAQSRTYGVGAKFAKALEASNKGKLDSKGGDFTDIKLKELDSNKDNRVDFTLITTVSPEVDNGRK